MFVIGEEEYDDVVVGFTVDTEVWLVVGLGVVVWVVLGAEKFNKP